MVMRFPAKKNASCPKAPRDFRPRKVGILLPPLGCFGTPLPLPQDSVRTYGRAYADVRIKMSSVAGLPDFRNYVAPLHTLRARKLP